MEKRNTQKKITGRFAVIALVGCLIYALNNGVMPRCFPCKYISIIRCGKRLA